MNANLDSQTGLTEFPPLSPEPDNTGIKSFFSSFFTKPNLASPDTSSNSGGDAANSPNNVAIGYPHILKKVGYFLPGKSSTLQSYKDSDMKQYWMPDSVSKECYLCGDKFTTFRRRHHCRICGQIFCSKCCNQEIPGKALGYSGDLRVCTYCCKQVLTYLNSTDTTQSADLKALQEDLEIKYGSGGNQDLFPTPGGEGQTAAPTTNERTAVTSAVTRKISMGYQEEKFASPRLTSDKTRKSIFLNLYDELILTLPCPCPGTLLIQWCFDHNKATNRAQAELIVQALLDSEYIKYISGPGGDTKFSPDAVYTIVCQDDDDDETNPALESNPMMISSNSTSSFQLDLNLEDSTATIRPNRNSTTRTTREIRENPNILPVHSLLKIIQAYRRDPIRPNNAKADAALTEKFETHRDKLLQQLIIVESLSMSWAPVILPLAEKVIEEVKPDQNIDSFDIRQYVRIKKVDDGSRNDSFVVSGIVHSKNVSHKCMLTTLHNPKILILQCAIVYQRVEGKLLSLEPVIMQEAEYLRNVVARISALKPDIVLVQRNVARLAQESLQMLGITLVLNVKTTVLERIARCTRADLVYSVDVLLNQIHLGTCSRFSVQKLPHSNKTLMFFEGCAFPHKGSTVILRGANTKELMKVKRVTNFMIYVLYNWKLESSLLMDEQAYVIQKEKPILQSPSDSVESNVGTKPGTEDKHKAEPLSAIQKPPSQSIHDASDPLQSDAQSDTVHQDLHLAVDNVPTNNFRKALDDIILSVSPTIQYTVPYLENDIGKKCELRKFFPENVYWSAQLDPAPVVKNENPMDTTPRYTLELRNPHPFVNEVLTESCQSVKVQSSLALFRACGGRLTPCNNFNRTVPPLPLATNALPSAPVSSKIDALQPSNHQRLPVLIYICRSPIHTPGFCVEPCTINMDFYARNDIPLGSFLEKYCFRRDYKCPSATCLIPTLEHERWFIHGKGSVCVSLCEIETKPPEVYDERIIMWNWCPFCKQISSMLPMSSDTWRLSLAKFLDLRFSCMLLGCKTASCTHRLHQEQVHYFALNNIVACFIYTPIKLYEICIPSTTLKKPSKAFDKTGLFEEVKKWSLMGQEVFSTVLEKLHNNQSDVSMHALQPLLVKDQANLKQKVDDIQMKLTDKEVINNLWDLEDAIVKLKRAVVEAINNWNSRLLKIKPKPKSTDSSKSLLTDIVEGTPTSENSTDYVFDSEESEESDVDHVDDSDNVKAKVPRMKQILSQLLPTNVPSLPINTSVESQQHHTLALGCSIPVVVYEQEPSSIISYGLSSFDYQFKLEELRVTTDNDMECKVPHIDIKFSDLAANFSVKMYFADLFSQLRSFSFPEGEESFIRSLSRCVRWEARGGKSGSNFCKTKDDRFILKEISRQEIDSFLTFAPNYYNYVKNCFENSSPTLLCKIFGVFRVICQNSNNKTRSNLLVMENLFHSRNIKLRYDLKGSVRNRLVDTSVDAMDKDAVLLDENFINRISETPLYIHPHSKFILMQAINNDTQFLAGQTVMDYSLLLGMDETNMELVVGMIDYIRTFTWDKKIETMVKKSGLLGGQGKLPTIVSPEEYRKRFQSAMDRYFLGVPDMWTGLVENISI
ncbi:hypothetical protein WDU94_003902 [Cyamophila willieti]